MTITRRELFGLAAGGAAVAVLPKTAEAKTYTVEEIANAVWDEEEIEVNVTRISGDPFAADNLEKYFL